MKNNFKLISSDGEVLAKGYNVVLETGRRFNGMLATGIPTTFDIDENTSDSQIVVDPRDCDTAPKTIAGFGLIGGILSNSVPNPNTSYLADFKPLDTTNVDTFIKIKDGHAWNGKVKLHAKTDNTNPYRDFDANGVEMFIHTLRTEKDEINDLYFNAVVMFASVVIGGNETFIPYSIFSLAPLENENEEFTHELKYSVYL